MKYKLKEQFTHDPNQALFEILKSRGVEDIENFISPTSDCELNPYDLDNIQGGANLLLQHLRQDNNILIIVD